MSSDRTRRVGRSYRWGIWGCAALAAAAGAASAQQTGQDQMGQDQWQQDQWRRQDQTGPQAGTQQRGMHSNLMVPQLRGFDLVHLEKEESGREYQVTVVDGRIVSAHVNGQFVPAQNVRVQGNTIRITDQNNQTGELRIPSGSATAYARSQRQRQFGTTEPRDRFGQQDRFDRQDQFRQDQWQDDRYQQDRYQQERYQQDRFRQDRYQQDRTQDDAWRTDTGLSHIGNTLGFSASPAPSSELRGTRAGERYDQAIRIDRVFGNSPAQNAGLRSGDLIVAIDGRTPATASTFSRTVNNLNPNEPLRLTVLRDGNPRTVTMRISQQDLRQLQQDQGRVFGTTEGFEQGRGMTLGIQATEASSRDLQNTRAGDRYNQGIVVEQVQQGSPAERHGLREGDIIVAIDGRTPATPDMLQQRLSQKNRGDTLQLDVVRDGQERNINVRFDGQSGMGRGTDSGAYQDDDFYFRGDGRDWDDVDEDHRLQPNKQETYRPSQDATGDGGRPAGDPMRDRMRPR